MQDAQQEEHRRMLNSAQLELDKINADMHVIRDQLRTSEDDGEKWELKEKLCAKHAKILPLITKLREARRALKETQAAFAENDDDL
jgi:hypothetical protein